MNSSKFMNIDIIMRKLSKIRTDKGVFNMILFLMFSFNTFVLLSAIHFQLDHSLLVSSLWKNPITFFEFYTPRILFSVGIASFIFYSEKKCWIIIPMTFLSIIYFVVRSLSIIWLDIYIIFQLLFITCLPFFAGKNNRIDCLKKYDKGNFLTRVLFSIVVIIQCFIFHWISFHEYNYFFETILLKISIVVIISSIAFLCKYKISLILLDLLIVIWMFAELMYFRANGIYMDAFTITMAGNMKGFWGSLRTLYTMRDFLLLLPMLLLFVPFLFKLPKQRSKDLAWITFSIGVIFNLLGCVEFQSHKIIKKVKNEETTDIKRVELNPFSEFAMGQLSGISMPHYIQTLSVLHAFIYNIKDYVRIYIQSNSDPLSKVEIEKIEKFINNNITLDQEKSDNKLVILLLESFESWCVDSIITPNLYSFINNNKNIAYIENILTQTKGGTSSDGQFITLTGLLPIQKGAVCFRYPVNIYPSLSSNFENCLGIFPHDLSVWNQRQMSEAYQFDTNYVTIPSDKVVIEKLIELSPKYDFTLAITSQTHTPFTATCDSSDLDLPPTMPKHLGDYIRSVNYLDKVLGIFFDEVASDSIWRNTSIVITGDHKIFADDIRAMYKDYCIDYNERYKIEKSGCPLIIYSPNINEKVSNSTQTYYQMDIYPTVLALIGFSDCYYWKGFGVNLLDSMACHNRPVTEEDACMLSDKIIRSDYFRQYAND